MRTGHDRADASVAAAHLDTACEACLRRGYLVGHLRSRIAGALARRDSRTAGLLSLGEQDLIAAVAPQPEDVGAALAFLDAFDCEAARASLREAGLAVLCTHCDEFPPRLRDLADPPAALFVAGSPAHLRELCGGPLAAVVGARRASPYGLDAAAALGRGLGAARVTVVSGLAIGIDAAAHRGCLDAGGDAIAVLAGGVDVPYPRHNLALYRRIRERGVVLSELPPGDPPMKWAFPARNRIMAALAGVTVVVEAAERSGSLITASFASQLGRTVAALPGRISSSKAEGSNRLLREGAAFVRGPEDVLDELFGVGQWATPRPVEPAARLEPRLRRVLEAVEDGEDVDGAARRAGLAPAQARAALGRLEAEGLVRRNAVGAYEPAL